MPLRGCYQTIEFGGLADDGSSTESSQTGLSSDTAAAGCLLLATPSAPRRHVRRSLTRSSHRCVLILQQRRWLDGHHLDCYRIVRIRSWAMHDSHQSRLFELMRLVDTQAILPAAQLQTLSSSLLHRAGSFEALWRFVSSRKLHRIARPRMLFSRYLKRQTYPSWAQTMTFLQ